jgi:hypothetical protein
MQASYVIKVPALKGVMQQTLVEVDISSSNLQMAADQPMTFPVANLTLSNQQTVSVEIGLLS